MTEPSRSPDSVEHDAARLHRQFRILEGKKKSFTEEIAAKRKDLRIVTGKLVTHEIQRRGS